MLVSSSFSFNCILFFKSRPSRSHLFFPKRQIIDSSKLKGFADDNFNFDENGVKFSERVENTVGKGEIARYEQFLLCPQCFQQTRKNQGLFGKGLNFEADYLINK